MKKIFSSVALVVLIGLLTTGCSHTPKSVREYKEWYEALQIEEHKGFEFYSFSDKDDVVSLAIECSEENLGAFNEVLKHHNEFVRSNPEYFSEDTRINILSSQGTPFPLLDCYNTPGDYFGEISGEGIEENNEIKYMSADVFEVKAAYEQYQNELSIPVLILTTHYTGNIAYEDFEFLEQFSDVEQVIVSFSELDYDMEEVVRAVHDFCPGADVYEEITGPELKKW